LRQAFALVGFWPRLQSGAFFAGGLSCCGTANEPLTVESAPTAKTQDAFPLQAPVQPANAERGPQVAVS
jgi:hypothetical protein